MKFSKLFSLGLLLSAAGLMMTSCGDSTPEQEKPVEENQGGNSEGEQNQGGNTGGENQGGSTGEENQGGETGGNDNNGGSTGGENQGGTTGGETGGTTAKPNGDGKTTIFLAGDSTVKTYDNDQYIAGWGQYLQDFIQGDVSVVNAAQGGRSSRSFINEGRLFKGEGTYSFDQNGGFSIEESIEKGDYLFIQFGHNDDDSKKASSYATLYDRMAPLGTPNAEGIYPTTEGKKVATTSLPTEYTSNVTSTSTAMKEIAKYGSTYYSYDCGGTYKWYLKQYIDFARAEGATPVLVTPVARVKLDANNVLQSGPGLHGDNFAYVEAVRQLAKEENCLLIDLFNETKTFIETATTTDANYLMALKPNSLVGTWPLDYDTTYGNTDLGYTGIEATHYNKYGAFLTAAKVAEIVTSTTDALTNGEEFKVRSEFTLTPKQIIDPSNLMSRSIVSSLEALFTKAQIVNPNRTSIPASDVIAAINTLIATEPTNDNYVAMRAEVEKVKVLYNGCHADDRTDITNYNDFLAYETKVENLEIANKPKPIKVDKLNPSDLTVGTYTTNLTQGGFSIYASSSKNVEIKADAYSFTHNLEKYSTTNCIKFGGTSDGTGRHLTFTLDGNATVTVVAKSSGTADRALKLTGGAAELAFDAKTSHSITTRDVEKGTYTLSSSSGGVYIYQVIIEYYA